MKKIYFVTSNLHKAKEAKQYLKPYNIDPQIFKETIQEILSLNVEEIVRDEVLQAYKKVGHPCVVEHGILLIKVLNDFPAGLSKQVWNLLKDDLCDFKGVKKNKKAEAISVIAYCDGKKIHTFTGKTEGRIASRSKGRRNYYWDSIFIPKGSNKTYGEMSPSEKKKYSQAQKAWKKFAEYFESASQS